MTPQLAEIYCTRTVQGRNGPIPLHSEIDPEEGAFLAQIIAADPAIYRTLEIGMAHGLSTLHICGALQGRPGAHHTALDPFQSSHWDDAGVTEIKRAGVDFFTLAEQRSEYAMPSMADAGRLFHLIFVDGSHAFDQKLVDCFFADRLLPVGGYLVLDDADHPSVARVVDYLECLPHFARYAELASEPKPESLKRRAAKALVRMVPAGLRKRLFHPVLLRRLFGKPARMVAFRKTGEDGRNWNWCPEGF